MSMHLMKVRVVEKSASKKWASSEQKQKAAALEESWNQLKAKYENQKPSTRSLGTQRKESKGLAHLIGFTPPRGTNTKVASRSDTAGVGAKQENPVYTGDKMIGVSGTHKSNDVPVFSKEYLLEITKMRR